METMEVKKQSMPCSARSVLSKPISLRLSSEEYEQLKNEAGQLSLSDYMRHRLFSDVLEEPPDSGNQLKARLSPQMRQKILAQILIQLGQSGVLNEVSQTLKAIRTGLINTSPEFTVTLNTLQDELQSLRLDLLKALGLRP